MTSKGFMLLLVATVSMMGCRRGLDPVDFPEPEGITTYIEGKVHFLPANGFVPDSITAIRVAESVLKPIYGLGGVAEQRPFTARLSDDVWVVRGTIPEMQTGSRIVVEIDKADARIRRVAID
jgi:hypothetical protein